jgi:hypothetical protein
LKDSRIMLIYSHYIGESYADDASAAIAKIYSSDKGKTWSERKIIIMPDEHNGKNIMSVSMLAM